MKTVTKSLLAAGMLALPLAVVQAQSGNTTRAEGESTDSAAPAHGSTTPKTPPMTMPAPTEKATGEAPESSKPGTDQPLATEKPADVNSPSADTMTRPSTQAGTPQQTAPSMEQPPRGAPMRTGPDSKSHDGTSTIQGTQKSN